MDFFGNILPFLFFIIFAVIKAKRREEQTRNERDRTLISGQEKRSAPEFKNMKDIKRIGGHVGDILRKEIHDSLGDILGDHPKEKVRDSKTDVVEEIEQYNYKSTQEFENNLDNPGVEVKNEIVDEIRNKEIGKKRITIDKKRVLDGVIMSEVLGKPKALRR